MNEKIRQLAIKKHNALNRFLQVWTDLGRDLADNPHQWDSVQQRLTRADSDLGRELQGAIDGLKQAKRELENELSN